MRAMIAIGIRRVPVFVRVVRAGVLQLRSSEFVLAARALGANPLTGRAVIDRILSFLGNEERPDDRPVVDPDAIGDEEARAALAAVLGEDFSGLPPQLMDENARRPTPRDARDVTMEAMVESALRSAALAESAGMGRDRIVLSAKVSGVQDLVDVYRMLAARCDYPLHLGLTEAGLGTKGIVASTAGLSILLQEGIGDTIRVSLTPAPGGDRTEEVQVAQQVLQSLGLRSFTPQVTSCPGCGRTTSTFFQEMAQQIQDYLREKMPVWRQERPGVAEMKVAVMGCVVNGPGESKHANIGISLPGTFEEPKAPVYVDGRLFRTLKGDGIVPEFLAILDDYVRRRFGVHEPAA